MVYFNFVIKLEFILFVVVVLQSHRPDFLVPRCQQGVGGGVPGQHAAGPGLSGVVLLLSQELSLQITAVQGQVNHSIGAISRDLNLNSRFQETLNFKYNQIFKPRKCNNCQELSICHSRIIDYSTPFVIKFHLILSDEIITSLLWLLLVSSVVDPHNFDADPDSDPHREIRIRIQLLITISVRFSLVFPLFLKRLTFINQKYSKNIF